MAQSRLIVAGVALLVGFLGGMAIASSQPRPPASPRIPGFPSADDQGPLPAVLNQVDPEIRVDGSGRLYRLWVDHWAARGRHIRFSRSTDGGKSWSEPLMLDRDKPDGAASTRPAIVADEAGRVMVMWRTKERGRKDIQFLGSRDGGATWPGPPRTLNRGRQGLSGDLGGDGKGHVYAVWYDERVSPGARRRQFRIFFNRSTDFGATWQSEDVELSHAPRTRQEIPGGRSISALPRIASDPAGGVYVAWMDNREGRTEIYLRPSEDHGKSWGPETNVSRGASSATNHQILTDGRGRVFVVWSDSRHRLEDVFFNRSEDRGKTWGQPVRLSRRPEGVTTSTRPQMALGPEGQVYVAWQDQRDGRDDIYLNVSLDGGRTWLDQDIRLDRDDPGTAHSREPYVIARGSGEIVVLWADDREGWEQILLNRSTDGGRTWLDREIRVSPASAGSEERHRAPRATWDRRGTLHVVWEVWKGQGQDVERRVEYRGLSLSGQGAGS